MNWNPPITPNRLRVLKREVRRCEQVYRDARRTYLAGHAERAAMPESRRVLHQEDGLIPVIDARRDMYHMRRVLAASVARGVETGAKWSPRGLANVRAANARRS